jgi:regulator of sigma E protease
VIAEVEPGSAAAAAGLVAGQVVTKIHLITATEDSADGKPSTKKPEEMSYQIASAPAGDKNQTSGTPLATIATVLRQLDMVKVREVAVSVAAKDKETVVKLAPVPAPGQFLVDRGFGQLNLIRPLPPQSMGASISRGISETKRSIGEIFGTIRALATQRVSRKLLGGPVTIASQAYASASEGMGLFLKFLGILSINLAVMNFLPIAPLDGGQMVFLIGEKIRGKPLPESFLALFSYMGLIAVLSLMVMVLYQDILRVFGLL